jgi:hypothetical protein
MVSRRRRYGKRFSIWGRTDTLICWLGSHGAIIAPNVNDSHVDLIRTYWH